MIEIKHTPGPWRHGFAMQNLNRMVRTDAGLICTLTKVTRYAGQDERYDEELKEAEANAKLIAAAPTMYAEMVRYSPILERLEKEFPEIWDKLTKGTGIATTNGYKNAIARATT